MNKNCTRTMPKREFNSKIDDFNKKMFMRETKIIDSDSESKERLEKLDYNISKPGPHAKAGEWRKWKNTKRAIRQERDEKRILKQKQYDADTNLNSSYQTSINSKILERQYSLSIAIPGSILNKIQSKELQTFLTGQIARAATLFYVDEIIIYNEFTIDNKSLRETNEQTLKILEYLECPQYLRKSLFPPNKHLEYVGFLPPIEAPHHLKINEDCIYREGVTTQISSKENKGSWVDIGLINKIQIDKKLEPGIRVTVKRLNGLSKKLRGVVVSPEVPRTESGLYWGYQVRYADSFGKILSESCFKERYDLKIAVNLTSKLGFDSLSYHDCKMQSPKRVLVVFGGISGIDAAIEADEKFKSNKIHEVFDIVCENHNIQFGSRSMRLEEAVLISLSMLSPFLKNISNRQQESSHNINDNENTKI